ncbi:MAG: GTP cyclohydrolase II [Janthinobacterium lividum]
MSSPRGENPASRQDSVLADSAASAVEHLSSARLPTRFGTFTAHAFRDTTGIEHLALVVGRIDAGTPVLARLHSECLTGDVLGSLRCDCGAQLAMALERTTAEGAGVVVYLRGQEGRGIGLANKIHAYTLQDEGRDTVDANLALGLPVDSRRYEVGAAILKSLGVASVRLMSNNPDKVAALIEAGIEVAERLPLSIEPNPENRRYLETKQRRLGHYLEIDEA